VTDDSGRAAWLSGARSYLRDADPVLARLIDERPDFDPRAWMSQLPAMDLFGALLFQVTGQQLSVAATRRILARIQDMFGGQLPAPAELLGAEPDQLRAAGLSWRKIRTLRDLAGRMSDGTLNADALSRRPGRLPARSPARAAGGAGHRREVAALPQPGHQLPVLRRLRAGWLRAGRRLTQVLG
jgi:HhH-GPD superfamily base excision DNA repair protein